MADDQQTDTTQTTQTTDSTQASDQTSTTITSQADTQQAQAKQPDWPDDWRAKLSGGDEKALKQLERYGSPADIWKKARALEQKMSSGEIKAQTSFPDKGTPEEQNAWRKEQGIPEKHDAYDTTLSDGLVIGDDDKPMVDGFLKVAHSANMKPEHVKSALSWYFQEQERQMQERKTADDAFRQQSEDELRGEWGQEFRGNVNMINGLLDTAPEGVKDMLLGARLADGKPLGNHPGVLRFLADLSRQINPTTTVVPNAGANVAGAIDDEIAGLEKQMGNRASDYWKGPTAEKLQSRYRQLIEARERVQKKAA